MIGCIIQARMNSTRLPGKVLMNIDEKFPALFYTVEQLKNSKLLEKIIIATSSNQEDNDIEKFCRKYNIKCFRGSLENVLDRYYQCAKEFGITTIVRIPADKPLIDPEIVDEVIQKFKENSFDCVTNFQPSTIPSGTEVEIFSFSALETAWKNTSSAFNKEHVTPYIYKNKEQFKIFNVVNKEDLSNFRWALDYKEDLELIRKIVMKIEKRPILTRDIINLLNKEKELIKINQNVKN